MSTNEKAAPGTIGWIDITVDDAASLRKFYQSVVGWTSQDVSMGEYSDYSMVPPGSDTAVAGICHSRGGNKGLPSGWLMYINVENLDESLAACREAGGEVVVDVKTMGGAGRYAYIRDPSGATVALFEPA